MPVPDQAGGRDDRRHVAAKKPAGVDLVDESEGAGDVGCRPESYKQLVAQRGKARVVDPGLCDPVTQWSAQPGGDLAAGRFGEGLEGGFGKVGVSRYDGEGVSSGPRLVAGHVDRTRFVSVKCAGGAHFEVQPHRSSMGGSGMRSPSGFALDGTGPIGLVDWSNELPRRTEMHATGRFRGVRGRVVIDAWTSGGEGDR